MFPKIVGGYIVSNTGSFTAWLLPLLIGIFTDPNGYLLAHPKIAATCAAIGLIGQNIYKLWTLWGKHSPQPTPAPVPAVVKPLVKAATSHSQPSPHTKRK